MSMKLCFRVALLTQVLLANVHAVSFAFASPALAAKPDFWMCSIDTGGNRVLSLSSSDLEAPFVDRQNIEVTCHNPATAMERQQATLCVAASGPTDGAFRKLKRDGNQEEISYRLSARASSGGTEIGQRPLEPGLIPQPVSTILLPTEPKTGAVLRFSFSLTVETAALRGRFLPEGRYQDAETRLSVSVHEGAECGPVAWEASLDSASSPVPTLLVPASCEIQTLAPIQFGTLPDLEVDIRRTGALGVRCSPGATYSIELGPGNQARNGARHMILEATGKDDADVLPYSLLAPNGRDWSGPSSPVPGETHAGVGTGVLTTIPVTGVIHAGTRVPAPGVYRDFVIAMLVY